MSRGLAITQARYLEHEEYSLPVPRYIYCLHISMFNAFLYVFHYYAH